MDSKKVGIMQPYLLPYIGYWQLLNAVDTYVIYDDVNYIKSGWINRKRILINGGASYFTIQVIGASSFKLINEIQVNNDDRLIEKNLKTIEMAYRKAPYFEEGYSIMEKILRYKDDNLANYLINSIKVICNYLEIFTEIIISSEMKKNNELKAQEKVLDICKELQATDYYNAIGGQELYSFDDFKKNNIRLHFLKTGDIEYKQFNNEFQPFLSIIDVIMFNSKEEIKEMLNKYTLIDDKE